MIGVALLGAGSMGATHRAAWSALEDRVEIITVLAHTLEEADQLASTVGARPTTDLAEAVGADGVDAVDVCLPTPLHRSAAEAAFAAGRHVLVEKPIASSLEDAEAMQAAAARAGTVFQVGHILRFWPAYDALHAVMADGQIGRARTVRTRRLCAPPWSPWFLDPIQSGGVAVDLMVHDFDQANALLGRALVAEAWKLRSVGPAGSSHVLARVRHEGGEAWIEGSTAMPAGFAFESSIEVLAERGVARYEFASRPVTDPGNLGLASSPETVVVHVGDAAPEVRPVAQSNAFVRQAEHFLGAITGQHPVERATPDQAVAALRVAVAVNRALISGSPEAIQ